MDDPKSRDEERNKLVQDWHAYGAEFGVFVPQEQPAQTVWDPDVEEFDGRGRVNPQYLKHWKFFSQTRDFLRERYAKYKILQGPAVIFDCLIRKFQPRIFNKSRQDQHGNPEFYEVNDSYEWYEQAIRMDIFEWQVGFKCRSYLCERDWCLLNRRNPMKILPVDIYSLVSMFEGISVAMAKSEIAPAVTGSEVDLDIQDPMASVTRGRVPGDRTIGLRTGWSLRATTLAEPGLKAKGNEGGVTHTFLELI